MRTAILVTGTTIVAAGAVVAGLAVHEHLWPQAVVCVICALVSACCVGIAASVPPTRRSTSTRQPRRPA